MPPLPPPSLPRELVAEVLASSWRERAWAAFFMVELIVLVVGLLALGPQPQTGGPR